VALGVLAGAFVVTMISVVIILAHVLGEARAA
jgi:hypothetical protein